MRKSAAIAVTAAHLLVLTSCAQITPEQVASEVRSTVPLGTNNQTALARLANIDFNCRAEGGNRYNLECTRQGGSGNLLAGCIQRVHLELDTANRVSQLRDPEVACAGL